VGCDVAVKELFEQNRGTEVNLTLSRRARAPTADGMEWTTMNEDDARASLFVSIGELLYKNQLLREAVASKDEVIELIISHLMIATTSACSCGVADKLTFVLNTVKERDLKLARRKRYCFNEFFDIVKHPIDSTANSPLDAAIRPAEK
jgi:hypothetical protein